MTNANKINGCHDPKFMRRARPWKSIFLQNVHSVFRSNSEVSKLCLNVTEHFHNLCKHCGMPYAIKTHKEIERHVRMCMLSQESKIGTGKWIKCKHNLPLFLKLDPNRLMVDDWYSQEVLTSLGYYKLFSLPPDDTVIKSITDGPSHNLCDIELDKIEAFAYKFFKQRNITPFVKVKTSPIYGTTKAGAHGAPAMGASSIHDALDILRLSIKSKIDEILPLVYEEEQVKLFQTIFDKSLDHIKSCKLNQRPYSARLHLISEGGGKTRAVCIPDIWTQSVLKPIHLYLMNVLRRMPCDGTFSHPALARRVKAFTNHHGLFCYDLTTATDRFPLEVQKRILKPLMGDLIEGWSDLIVNRDIKYKKEFLRYGVGQPMGMLTSWAAFTISHHIIINYCKNDKSFYAVIGDDMVLHNEKAALKYRQVMSDLGVDISESKTLIPNQVSNTAEIAKRYFRNGNDISPIPPRVLLESSKNLSGFFEFIEVLASRTGNFQDFPGLSWSETLSRVWKQNRDSESEAARAVLTCPMNDYFPFLKRNQKAIALLTEVTSPWDRSKDPMIKNSFDRFILDETVRQLNGNKLVLKASGMPPSRPGPNEPRISPLIESYLSQKEKDMTKYVRLYVGTYIDEEGDSFEPTPQNLLEYLLSEPDPLSPKDFQEKRKIRRTRSLNLIERFWKENSRIFRIRV